MEIPRESHTRVDFHFPKSSPSFPDSPACSFSSFSPSAVTPDADAVDGDAEKAQKKQILPEEKAKMRFLGSVSKNRESTWVVSLFVLLHIFVFAATMFVNDCSRFSHGDCAFRFLGRLSFQPLPENPLLGPSFSALDIMGALRQKFMELDYQYWRIFACIWLHAGVFHLFINLLSVVFVGIHLEQKFGPWRVGIIYILSALTGSLVAAIFAQNTPAVCSSAALFGLIGGSLSGIIRDCNMYIDKYLALLTLFVVFIINFLLGLLPYIDNFANAGGFLSGLLLGFLLFFSPHLRKKSQNKGIFDYGIKNPMGFRQKLDRPVLRGISLFIYGIMLVGLVVAVHRRFNANKLCTWCHYLDCIPSKSWICEIKPSTCKSSEGRGRVTIACMSNDHFLNLPYTDISPRRLQELCVLICI